MSSPTPGRVLLALVLLTGAAVPVAAQVPDGAALARVAALRPVEREHVAAEEPRTYQAEGAIIGALALGLPVFLISANACALSGCEGEVHLKSLGALAVGAFLGALIGGSIEREPADTARAP